MSDIERYGARWIEAQREAAHREAHALEHDCDPTLYDWLALVSAVRERDEAWRHLRDAADCVADRKRIKAEAER